MTLSAAAPAPTQSHPKQRRSWRRRLLAVAIGILLAPIGLELAARLLPISLPPGIRAAVSLHDLRFITQADPELGYVMRPGFEAMPLATSDFRIFSVTTRPAPWSKATHIGFRDPFAVSPAWGVVVGDSFAMGWGVDDGDVFVRATEQAIGKPIYDLGVSGYGPHQALGTLERFGLGCAPKVVVWLFYGNDIEDTLWFDAWTQHRENPWFTPKSEFGYALNRYSAAYKLIRYAGKSMSSGNVAWRDGERSHLFTVFWRRNLDLRSERITRGFALMETQLARFRALADAHGFVPVFLAAPYREQVFCEEYAAVDPSPDSFEVQQAAYTKTVARARELGFTVLDTLELLRGHKLDREPVYLWEDPHWSVAGNRVVGEALAEVLRQFVGR